LRGTAIARPSGYSGEMRKLLSCMLGIRIRGCIRDWLAMMDDGTQRYSFVVDRCIDFARIAHKKNIGTIIGATVGSVLGVALVIGWFAYRMASKPDKAFFVLLSLTATVPFTALSIYGSLQ
jgi:hypothetical protein